ncbi:ABC-2 family transporter protein [uncultured archaeon]|nr:ABC-2 family transporter protein [uncultured archaeon]
MKYTKLITRCAGIWLMRDFAYKYDFFIKTLAVAVYDVLGPLIALFIYSATPGLPGWNFYQFLLFQGTLIIVFGLGRTFSASLAWWTLSAIYLGEFDQYLLKPYPTLLYLMALTVDHYGLVEVAVGTTVVTYSATQLGIPLLTISTLIYIFLIITAFFVHLGSNIIISSMGFLAVKSEALLQLYMNLMDFARYPLNVYGPGLRFFLTFLFPIAVTSFFPAQVLLKGAGIKMLAIAIIPVAIYFTISLLLWNTAMKKYRSAGG